MWTQTWLSFAFASNFSLSLHHHTAVSQIKWNLPVLPGRQHVCPRVVSELKWRRHCSKPALKFPAMTMQMACGNPPSCWRALAGWHHVANVRWGNSGHQPQFWPYPFMNSAAYWILHWRFPTLTISWFTYHRILLHLIHNQYIHYNQYNHYNH